MHWKYCPVLFQDCWYSFILIFASDPHTQARCGDRTSGRRRNCLTTHSACPIWSATRYASQISGTLPLDSQSSYSGKAIVGPPLPKQSLVPLDLMCLKHPLPRPVPAQRGDFSPPLLPSVSCRKTEESFACWLTSRRMWFLHRFIPVSLAFGGIVSEGGNSAFEIQSLTV